jgi:hypothetical protein
MDNVRDHIETDLKRRVVPELRSRGFKGSFPHFRRPSVRGLDLLTFQFDRNGGGFVVELACAPATGITTYWGKRIEPAKVTAWDVHPNERWRLGSPPEGDSWFRYDTGDVASCVSKLLDLLSNAEHWWSQRAAV